ncbi:MAG: hypothetical protein ACXW3P_00410 [Rhodospirillales bacterium]
MNGELGQPWAAKIGPSRKALQAIGTERSAASRSIRMAAGQELVLANSNQERTSTPQQS